MHLLRFLLRALIVVPWVGLGLVCVTVIFPFIGAAGRRRLNRIWSRCLLRLCGVSVRVSGELPASSPQLWVANHVSWLDIFVINAVTPLSFIAKQEIRRWPFVGWLVAGAGTVFIDRSQRHAILAVAQSMQSQFEQGASVGLFPEGRTSEGLSVAPFHSSLFQAAIETHVGIQPVALRYFEQDQRSTRLAFVGDQTLLANAWLLLGARGVSVKMSFLPAISAESCACMGRTHTASLARSEILQVVESTAETLV